MFWRGNLLHGMRFCGVGLPRRLCTRDWSCCSHLRYWGTRWNSSLHSYVSNVSNMSNDNNKLCLGRLIHLQTVKKPLRKVDNHHLVNRNKLVSWGFEIIRNVIQFDSNLLKVKNTSQKILLCGTVQTSNIRIWSKVPKCFSHIESMRTRAIHFMWHC